MSWIKKLMAPAPEAQAAAPGATMTATLASHSDQWKAGSTLGGVGGVVVGATMNGGLGQWIPNSGRELATTYDGWSKSQEEATQAKVMQDRMRQYQEQREAAAMAMRRGLSKAELMRGILDEMTKMRERMDTLTAALAAEVLTGEAEPAGRTYTPNQQWAPLTVGGSVQL